MNPRAFISTSTITSIAKTAYSTAVTPTTATLFHSFKASFKLPYRRKGRDSPIQPVSSMSAFDSMSFFTPGKLCNGMQLFLRDSCVSQGTHLIRVSIRKEILFGGLVYKRTAAFRSDPYCNQAVSVPIPLTQAKKTRQARQAFRQFTPRPKRKERLFDLLAFIEIKLVLNLRQNR